MALFNTNVARAKMGGARGAWRCRRVPVYCHVILVTSLVWLFIDAMVLFYVTSNSSLSSPAAGSNPSEADSAVRKRQSNEGDPLVKKESAGRKKEVKPQGPVPVPVPNPKHAKIIGAINDLNDRDKNPPDLPGEQGKAVELNEVDKELSKNTYKENQFNLLICERISLNRSLPDHRPEKCKTMPYRRDLQSTSVVIVFHQEAWCTLIRSVYSIINRSPKHLIQEIILVDDASTKEHLKENLTKFVDKQPLLKLVRLETRSGLIKARLAGADAASGEVIVFLDSHIETSHGWLEPLLHEIREDRTRVVVPTIDNINLDTFHYATVDGAPQIGGFTWSLTYFWYQLTHSEKKRVGDDYSQPVRSPAMAGGLFAIDRNYFYEIGSYDAEMEIWGGENIEMSLRIWQCGGSIWILPCSKVGHVFRKQSPYGWPGGVTNILGKNNRRLAEVWLDEYINFWFFISPGSRNVAYGDVSDRRELRKNLKCKSFNWYIQNVWPESSYNLAVYFLGQIENPESKLCIDTMARKQDEKVGAVTCHHQGGNQAFALTKDNELRSDDLCVDASKKNEPVILYRCHKQGGNQYWFYDEKGSRQLRHKVTNQCLTVPQPASQELHLQECDSNNPFQVWAMENAKELTELLQKYKT